MISIPIQSGNSDVFKSQDPFIISPFLDIDIQPIELNHITDVAGNTYSKTTPSLSLDEMYAFVQNLATTHDNVEIDFIGKSVQDRNMYALRINDDGVKPVYGISNAIHGNEVDNTQGIFSFFKKVLDINNTDPALAHIRDNVTIVHLVACNPDSIVLNQRYNANDVDLNRHFPYSWSINTSSAKGSAPASEIEAINIIQYLTSTNIVKRVITWLDFHQWGFYGQDYWGLLTHQIYDSQLARSHQRGVVQYIRDIMKKRIASGVYNDFDMRFDDPIVYESRSRNKPYIINWIKKHTDFKEAWCGVVESPGFFNPSEIDPVYAPGSIGEYLPVCSLGSFDVLHGLAYATADVVSGAKDGFFASPDLGIPLNINPTMEAWDSDNRRPQYYRYNKAALSQSTQDGKYAVLMEMPSFGFYPKKISLVSSAQNYSQYFNSEIVVTYGGRNQDSQIRDIRTIRLSDGKIISQPITPALPQVQSAAIAISETKAYVSGGFTSHPSTTYQDGVYQISHADLDKENPAPQNWVQIANLPIPVQRHSMAYWEHDGSQYLIVSGGRSSSEYISDIYKIRVGGGSVEVTKIGDLAGKKGYHTSCVYNNVLYVFGGYSGSVGYNKVERFDLLTNTLLSDFRLPNTRREHGMAFDRNTGIAYLTLGRQTSSIWHDTIVKVDLNTEETENINPELASDGDREEEFFIPQPYRTGMITYYDSDLESSDKIGIVCGLDKDSDLETDTYYEYILEDNLMTVRSTADSSWSWLRPNRYFKGDPGDEYLITVELKNADPRINRYPENDVFADMKDPSTRLIVKTGDSISQPDRNLRTGYFTPSSDGFQKYTYPLILKEGEPGFRCWLRLYRAGTKVFVRKFEVHKVVNVDNVVQPKNVIDYTIQDASYKTRKTYVKGVLSPFEGTQRDIPDTTLLNTECDPSFEITNIKLKYTAHVDESLLDQSQLFGKSRRNFLHPTGKFYLEYTKNGSVETVDVFDRPELNLYWYRQHYRRDMVHFDMKINEGAVVFSIYFYGSRKEVRILGTARILSIKSSNSKSYISIEGEEKHNPRILHTTIK